MHDMNQPISEALAQHAIAELLMLGYTLEGEDLNPPEDSAAWCALACERLGFAAGVPERAEVANGRARFELAYAMAWRLDSKMPEPVEQLAKEVAGWRQGNTYPGDLPRLRFAWEGFQWANGMPTGAAAPATYWAVIAKCGEGVLFQQQRDAQWTVTGKGAGSDGFGVPTIGEAFRDAYAGQDLQLVTVQVVPAAGQPEGGA